MVKANISWNAKQIAKAVEMGSMTFDNAIQRGHVWDRKRQSLFVDSLLRNFPVPAIYTIKTDIDAPAGCKKGSKVFDCIDGKQRCEAIRAFRNNEYTLEQCDLFVSMSGVEVDLNGKTYSELDEEWQDTFDSYTMTVYFFTEISDEEVSEMMSRLNNGKPLTGVENARIKAKNLDAIKELGNHKLFKETMSATAIASYNNEDVVIKTALQTFKKQYELSVKNVKQAYETLDFTSDEQNTLEELFDIAYETLCCMKETVKKSVLRKAIKKTNLVSFLQFIAEHEDESEEDMARFLAEFFDDDSEELCDMRSAYNDACTNGTNHASNVLCRNKALSNAFFEFVKM